MHGKKLRLYFYVLTQGENPLLDAGCTPLLENEGFGRAFSLTNKPSQANLSDVRSLDGGSTPERKGMDKREFEQWPHVTRFENGKTSFRREITGSTHSRPVTFWQTATWHHQCSVRQAQAHSATTRVTTQHSTGLPSVLLAM